MDARRGRLNYVLPVVMAVAFPLTLVPLAIAALVLYVWGAVRLYAAGRDRERRRPLALTIVARGAWLAVAVLGLIALINDVRDIAAVT